VQERRTEETGSGRARTERQRPDRGLHVETVSSSPYSSF